MILKEYVQRFLYKMLFIPERIYSLVKAITTRDDKAFCSSHRLSLRYGTQCAMCSCLTLHVSTSTA